MKKIASFTVDHTNLKKGMYVSRVDGDIVTYDIRMKLPNGNDYLDMASAHTIEHLFATYARNTAFADDVIYIGPMGCRTGFYFLVRDTVSHEKAIEIVVKSMRFICDFEGEVPGVSEVECGNYLEHNLEGAKKIAADMEKVLSDWTERQLNY